MSRQEQLLNANWARMQEAIDRAVIEHGRTIELLRAVRLTTSTGERPSPDAVIAEVARITHTSANADLVHRLATWAETINELLLNPMDGDQ